MPAGVPPLWNDPEAFDKAVDEYFATCKEENERPLWTGLAIHLGFESRKSLWEYGKKPEFSNSVKKALLRIENQYEKGLHSSSPAGAIFALKNFNWADRQEIKHEGIGIGFLSIDPLADDQTDNGTTKDSATKEA